MRRIKPILILLPTVSSTQLLMPYQLIALQISVQNLEIKKLLFDLKINTYITKNKTIYDKISDEYDNYTKKSKITETETFDNDTFTKLTGISVEEAGKLNKSEKIMLQLWRYC